MRHNSESRSNDRGKNSLKDALAPFVAILILLAFALFILDLLTLTKAQETEWQRAMYLFSGVQSIAFAAAGFFFGSELQRKRAERAEESTQEAASRAMTAERKAIEESTKGVTLAEAVRSELPERDTGEEEVDEDEYDTHRRRIPDAARYELRILVNLANKLYPPETT